MNGARLFWGAAAAVVALYLVGAVSRNRDEKADAAAAAASAAELRDWERDRAAFLQKKCRDEISATASAAASALKASAVDDAVNALAECEDTMTDPGAVALLDRARKIQAAAIDKRIKSEGEALLALKRQQGVSIGMSRQDALDSSWGRPERVNTTTTARGTREQWVYGRSYLYFENGVLTSIQN